MALPGLWLCGPMGVGKSTVGYQIFTAIHRSGRKAAYVDADQLGMCYPAPGDDPKDHRLKAANVEAIWRNFRSAGATCLIVSGGIVNEEELRLYRQQLTDVSLLACRLSIDEGGLQARLEMRGAGYEPPVPGRQDWRQPQPDGLREAMAELELLRQTTFADLVIDSHGLTPIEVATKVRDQAGGWPPP